MRHSRFAVAVPSSILLARCGVTSPVHAANPPINDDHGHYASVIRLPNGNLRRLRTEAGEVHYEDSSDSGQTWLPTDADPQDNVDWFMGHGSWVGSNPITTFDGSGNAHVFHRALPALGAPPSQQYLYGYRQTTSGFHGAVDLRQPHRRRDERDQDDQRADRRAVRRRVGQRLLQPSPTPTTTA